MYHRIAVLLFSISMLLTPPVVFATDKVAGSTGQLVIHVVPEQTEKIDDRVVKLQAYLRKFNSPLAPYAEEFIKQADTHSLDWKLVASIAGLESTFGKRIPYGSFNAWGWGIPTGAQRGLGFKDWKDGIATVSEGLKQKYVDRGLKTPEQMGRIYAASPTWASRVSYFMNDIETFNVVDNNQIAMNL